MDQRGGGWGGRPATYRIVAHQIERTRVVSEVVCVNPHGEKVAAATPVMKVVA